ncbi:hypothetical protein C808_05308 [Lachnospiraceae bacterium M18-1]|nr:hypothetical protein C808_05308 [Lachnospiraceae bacterium M18-1]
MKKIKNMTAAEAKQAFTKWEAKHPRHDDFDFNAAQIGNYKNFSDKLIEKVLLI